MPVPGALAQAMREALRDDTTLEELHAAVYAAYIAVDVDAQARAEAISKCPACHEPIDYCQGHGEIGDPAGHAVLMQYDDDTRKCYCGARFDQHALTAHPATTTFTTPPVEIPDGKSEAPVRCLCGWDDDGTLIMVDRWKADHPPVPYVEIIEFYGDTADEERHGHHQCPRCDNDLAADTVYPRDSKEA